ncbi:MAG: hypothetical protein COA42_13860 [Alteromonadaceae bacterium]|nr:MAG: hypothetical protein COA42_13860 [Alteromonadaceae bacterium]
MLLSWKETESIGECSEGIIHKSEYNGLEEAGVKLALGECVEKSTSFLHLNINDESLYLLFEWCVLSSVLTIVVTDSKKQSDSPHVVQCSFNEIETENVQYWLRDYITTCQSFMNYSLVAAFHCKSRAESTLL